MLHFTLRVEETCAQMRRETALGMAGIERRAQIDCFIREQGEMLARVATGGPRLTDELKPRILNTLLTLMNLRENLDRAK